MFFMLVLETLVLYFSRKSNSDKKKQRLFNLGLFVNI